MTATTVITVSRASSALRGNTEAIASAAEAPQIPTEPPVSTPKLVDWRVALANSVPHRIVRITATAVSASTVPPSDSTWAT